MKYSSFQETIFTEVESSDGSLLVDAKAGSGKTTTMVASMQFLHPEDTIAALAFNKAIATVLQTKCPPYVNARTFNSLGYGTLMKKFPGFKMDTRKNNTLLRQTVPTNFQEDSLSELTNIMRHGKAFGVGLFVPNEEGTWLELIEDGEFDIDEKIVPQAAGWLARAYKKSLAMTDIIDFDDQILFPLIYNIRGKQHDALFVDEAQDLSPLQHEFIKRFLAPRGRVIAFGDPRQAIYAFRGADTNSMGKLGLMFDAKVLPLSICYRCSQSVIREAQIIVPDIICADTAPEGSVEYIQLPEISSFKPTDLVLCRNNAPLVTLGLRFLAANKPVNVRGEFGTQVINFVKKFKTDDIKIFSTRLDQWFDVEHNMAEKEGKFRKMYAIEEKYEAIRSVIENTKPGTVNELINTFQRLFDAKTGTTLSSIHRAKGEEAPNVYLIKPEFIPSKYATTEAQLQQEMNLKYVAITRAQENFYYTNMEG